MANFNHTCQGLLSLQLLHKPRNWHYLWLPAGAASLATAGVGGSGDDGDGLGSHKGYLPQGTAVVVTLVSCGRPRRPQRSSIYRRYIYSRGWRKRRWQEAAVAGSGGSGGRKGAYSYSRHVYSSLKKEPEVPGTAFHLQTHKEISIGSHVRDTYCSLYQPHQKVVKSWIFTVIRLCMAGYLPGQARPARHTGLVQLRRSPRIVRTRKMMSPAST